jgi:hypothetical protein
MNEDERALALTCYGYGRWNAPYWFIGPEQGQGKWENKALIERARAFRKLNRDGLCDCRAFHIEIKEKDGILKTTTNRIRKRPVSSQPGGP